MSDRSRDTRICSGIKALGKRLGMVCTHGASRQRRAPGGARLTPGATLRKAALKVTLPASSAAQGTQLQPTSRGGLLHLEGAGHGEQPAAALSGAREHAAGAGRGERPGRPRGGGAAGGSAPPLPASSNGPRGYTLTAPRGSRFPGGWSCGEGKSGT